MTPEERQIVDAIAAAARRASSTTSMPADESRERVRAAIRAARARPPSRWRRPVAGAAIVVAAAALLVWVRSDEPAREVGSTSPRVTTLRSGDQIVTFGSELAVQRDDGHERVVELRAGEALFDVSPLQGDGSFAVVTADCVVRVRGTVFSVSASALGTTVRVYEGSVQVERVGSRERRALGAGDSFGALREPDVFHVEAERRVHHRRLVASQFLDSARRIETSDEETAAPTRGGGSSSPRHDALAPSADAPGGPSAAGRERRLPERASAPDGSRQVSADAALADARQHVVAGRPERALELVQRARPEGRRVEWARVEVDALRALGRYGEAADRLEVLATRSPPREAARAGFLAASLRFNQLSDPSGAIRVLERFACADDPSLAERALVLHVRALAQLGREAEATRRAAEYLERFPDGGRRAEMARWASRQ